MKINMGDNQNDISPLSDDQSLTSYNPTNDPNSTYENTARHHNLYHERSLEAIPRSPVVSSLSTHSKVVLSNDEYHLNQKHDKRHNTRLHTNKCFPAVKFGRKGILIDNTRFVTIPEQTGQKLKWSEPPDTVLVLRKSFGENLFEPFIEVLLWLSYEKKLTVFIESKALTPIFLKDERYEKIKYYLRTFDTDNEDLTGRIDLVVCLGGDGTLMHAASLFQQSVPPVMSFHLGSLGFLAPFQFREFKDDITQALEGNATLLLRSRLECIVCKAGLESSSSKKNDWKNILVLNEVVLDRGLSPFLCNLDLYVERHLVTSVQGDGIIISTPTGSTAYAVAAGASMMHPSVPSIMITPICPHSLSFRPIVVPAGVEIKLMVSKEARNTAWVSFDGRSRQELKIGDCVKIKTATHPVPSICSKDPIDDWFNSLAECLHWNVRKLQGGPSSNASSASLNSEEIDFN
ncbi:NAD kinase-like isoform X1 [Argonauta hians]